jgi:HPt (histidine-containing phosphotransfer) domain-containing protein
MSSLPDDPPDSGLREKLLGRTHGDLEALHCALAAGDFPTIVHLAHRLAGAAGALGLEALSAAGRDLEREGERRDADSVKARLAHVAHELARASGHPD